MILMSVVLGVLVGCASQRNIRVAGYRPIQESFKDERRQTIVTLLSEHGIPIAIKGTSDWVNVSVPEHQAEEAKSLLNAQVIAGKLDVAIEEGFVTEAPDA